MDKKKLLPLAISIGVMLFVVVVALKLKSHPTVAQKMNKVVVAKVDIGAGNAIGGPDQLELKDSTADASPTDGTFHSLAEVSGRVTTVPLTPGQIVTQNVLAPIGTVAGLQATVPAGQRAMTIDINEITGVAGNILPGSHVDIVQVLKNKEGIQSFARMIAQNVIVATTGMRHSDGDGGGRSVTVYVSPQQAELLELASLSGRQRLILRGENDTATYNVPNVTLADLSGIAGGKNDPFSPLHSVMDAIFNTFTSNRSTTRPSDETMVQATDPFAGIALSQSSSTTRPTITDNGDSWTIHVVKGGADSTVTFPLHRYESRYTSTNDQ